MITVWPQAGVSPHEYLGVGNLRSFSSGQAVTLVHHTKPSGLSSYAEGDPPTTWNDESGQANHSLLANPSGTVSVRKAGLNGYDYVEIAGDDLAANDRFDLTNELGATGSRTVIQVLRFPVGIQNGNWSHNLETFFDTNVAGKEHFINFNPISGTEVKFNAGYTGNGTDDLSIVINNVESIVVGRWFIVALTFDGETLNAYLNDVAVSGTDTVSGFVPDSVEDDTPVQIGQTSRMDVAENQIYDGVPNNLTQLISDLSGKYRIAVAGVSIAASNTNVMLRSGISDSSQLARVGVSGSGIGLPTGISDANISRRN